MGRAGKREEARKVLGELNELSLQHYVRAFHYATVHLGLDEYEMALDWLDKSLEKRDSFMANLAADARFQPLRVYPRFIELLRQVGFPVETGNSH